MLHLKNDTDGCKMIQECTETDIRNTSLCKVTTNVCVLLKLYSIEFCPKSLK